MIASGGMASVHIGRLVGPVGFARTVAIKRLHQNFANDPDFVAMLLDEARLVSRVRHPNVVPTLDVCSEGRELLLVMEYVLGESLAQLLRQARATNRPAPIPVIADIMVGVLEGLHAAHEATSPHGEPLGIVHRDVSPHNILVGADGVARVLDFGIAKAAGRLQETRDSQVKGKLRYMPAEQLLGRPVSRASDVYSAGVVLWEALAGRRLLDGESEEEVMFRVVNAKFPRPSEFRADIPRGLDDIVMRALERAPEARFATAKAMASALEAAVPPVTRSAVSDWVLLTAGPEIRKREERVAAAERSSGAPTAQNDPGSQRTKVVAIDRRSHSSLENSTLHHAGSVSRSVSPSSAPERSRRRRRMALPIASGLLLAALGGVFARSTLQSASREVASAVTSGAIAPLSSASPPVDSALSPKDIASAVAPREPVPPPSAAQPVAPASAGSKPVRRVAPRQSSSKVPRRVDSADRLYRRD